MAKYRLLNRIKAVENNNGGTPGESAFTSLSEYASFAAAVSAIGTDPVTLVINTNGNVAAATTIPATLTLLFIDGKTLTKTSSGSLTFNGVGVTGDPRHQIFTDFSAGDVTWTAAIPPVRPEWFGAIADNTTNCLPAFNAIVEAVDDPATQSIRVILQSNSKYRLNDVWEVDVPFSLESDSPGADNWYATAEMTWPVNKSGIIVHHTSTKTGVNDGRSAIFSRISNVALIGAADYTETHTVNLSGLTLTKTAGQDFSSANGYADGTTVTVSGFTYVIQSVGSTTQATLYKPRLTVAVQYGSTKVGIGDYNSWPTGGEWNDQEIIIDGDTYQIDTVASSSLINITSAYLGDAPTTVGSVTTSGAASSDALTATAHGLASGQYGYFSATTGSLPTGLSLNTPVYIINDGTNSLKFATSRTNALAGTAISLSGGGGDHTLVLYGYVGDGELQSLASVTGRSARANTFHGITAKAPVVVSNCKIWHFPGHGIALDSITGLTAFPGTTPNNNNSAIIRNSLYYNRGHGIWLKGINSNQSYLENNDVTNNYGAGIFEASFLGNNHFGNHTSFNFFGGVYGTGSVNVAQFYGHYDEGGQPSSRLDQYMKADGGNWGAGFDRNSTGPTALANQGAFETRALRSINNSTKPVAVQLAVAQPNTILGFGAAEESFNLGSGGSPTAVRVFAWQLGYDQFATGWYGLYFGGNYASNGGSPAIALSGGQASQGGGVLAFPNGFRFGASDTHFSKMLHGTATLASGTVTVNNANVKSNSIILLTGQDGNANGNLWVSARVADTSFTITSSDNTDNGVVGYLIINP